MCDIEFKVDNLDIPGAVKCSFPFSEGRRKFYLEGDGTFGLDSKIIKKINKCVDWELMAHYGYTEIKL